MTVINNPMNQAISRNSVVNSRIGLTATTRAAIQVPIQIGCPHSNGQPFLI